MLCTFAQLCVKKVDDFLWHLRNVGKRVLIAGYLHDKLFEIFNISCYDWSIYGIKFTFHEASPQFQRFH